MKLKAGNEAEYKKRHDEIWPELAVVLTEAGVSSYTIFLDAPTLSLFAVWTLTEDNTTSELPNHPLVQKWWAYMQDIMETNPDNSPVVEQLSQMFHMD